LDWAAPADQAFLLKPVLCEPFIQDSGRAQLFKLNFRQGKTILMTVAAKQQSPGTACELHH